MITFNNTKTLLELVKNIGKEFENNVFLRYERDDTIFEKGYGTFSMDTMSVAVYIEGQIKKQGIRFMRQFLENAVMNISRFFSEYLVAAEFRYLWM